MSGRNPSRRVVLTLLQQSGGSLTLSLNDPGLSALHRRLQELAEHGKVELALRSSAAVTYRMAGKLPDLPARFQPSDANG